MRITNRVVASKLSAYLQMRLPLAQLVDWAENAIMDGDFEGKDSQSLVEIVGRIGLADVREFGLGWEDCIAMLSHLGYGVDVDVVPQKHRSTHASPWRERVERYAGGSDVTTTKHAESRKPKVPHKSRKT